MIELFLILLAVLSFIQYLRDEIMESTISRLADRVVDLEGQVWAQTLPVEEFERHWCEEFWKHGDPTL